MEEEKEGGAMNAPKEIKAAIIFEEVSSLEWKLIHMSDQEEDLINRMYRLVGDRWNLIAGRIPGRSAEEIERFWVMQNGTTEEEESMNDSSSPNGRREEEESMNDASSSNSSP